MSDIMPKGHTPKADWSDEDYDIFAHWIRGVLRTNKTEVIFTKKDGTERTMNCTLDPDLIPALVVTEDTIPKKEKKKDGDPYNIRTYDTDKQAWRSFNAKSVKSVKFSLGEPIPVVGTNWPFPTGQKP